MAVVNYPIGDFLISLKNTALAKRKEFIVNNTKFIRKVADELKRLGYIDEVKSKEGKLFIKLSYRKKEPVLFDLKLVSKPGMRVYMGIDDLEKIKRPSVFIISTPKGVMSSKKAKKLRQGGEVIVEIW
jgi:small subunit ribosomal protein S8